MNFTVVRAVRGTEPTASEPREQKRSDKLQGIIHGAVPMPPAAMDLPYSDVVVRLDFVSAEFERTTPGRLA